VAGRRRGGDGPGYLVDAFIGMLAFDLPIPVGYDLGITLYSLAVSIGASAYALWLVSRPSLPWRRLLAGAVLMGLGIATMHYLGMAAMRMQPGIDYHPGWFAASIAVAIGAAGARCGSPSACVPSSATPCACAGLAGDGPGHRRHALHRHGGGALPRRQHLRRGRQRRHRHALAGGAGDRHHCGHPGHRPVASLFDRQMRVRTGLLADSLAHANDKLIQAALHDPLTQLPNRMLLQDRIEQAIEKARRRNRAVAVMFCDLDGFKAVNDAYGHQLGDRLLVAVAQRIGGLLRPQDTFARLGGDEFVIVLAIDTPTMRWWWPSASSPRPANRSLLDAAELQVSASLGIALYPDDAGNERELMAHADAAMYHTKETGRNGYTFFTPSMQLSANRQLRLLQDLRKAIARDELMLHYQPKFPAAGAPATGAEALLRWQHPELGLLAPDVFIPIAERSGLILPIGDWVLDRACAQLRAWHEAGHTEWSMAVNLSPLQFASPALLDSVREVLQRHRIEPARLTLEITETTAMKDVDASLAILNDLTAMGVHIAIDDFGTGYSSLLYLKRMPATELKIDRAFVHDLERNDEDAAIVSSIIALGRTLQLQVVAEGVETQAQREYLSELGCDQLQGYHLGRPMDAEEFLRRVAGSAIRASDAGKPATPSKGRPKAAAPAWQRRVDVSASCARSCCA
jgi:diguanylate cyclase (GGDEF)-like protein